MIAKYLKKTLTDVIVRVIEHAKNKMTELEIEGTLEHLKHISLYDCQKYFHDAGGPEPMQENGRISMRPDGGIVVAVVNGKKYPILITEDKVQGTNDKLHFQGKPRQSAGNAIERVAKNMRGAEMIFAGRNIFPYVIFASGCDFHPDETIGKRLEMMNYGQPNHCIPLSNKDTPESITECIESIINAIDITKRYGVSIAAIFVKAHKWDEMKHGVSMWTKDELFLICCKIIDLALHDLRGLAVK